MNTAVILALAVIAILVGSPSTHAASLNVIEGRLHGASGVNVRGRFFDIEFLEGTCINFYNGCDSYNDFPFPTGREAFEATFALREQVFLDGDLGLFDSIPDLTFGCSAGFVCASMTPFFVRGTLVATWFVANFDGESNDTLGDNFFEGIDLDTTDDPRSVYVRWTPVPEPVTALLFGMGLFLLARQER